MSSRRRFLNFSLAACAASAVTAGAQLLQPIRGQAEPSAADAELQALTAATSQIWMPGIIYQLEPTAIPPTATAVPPAATVPPTTAPTATVVLSDDAPIIGAASGTVAQAAAYISARADASYTDWDIANVIIPRYQQLGEWAGMDWFLAVAQMCHETGSLTSWWSLRPRRNPAGLGVTGSTQTGSSDQPPNGDASRWAWHDSYWAEGISFSTWEDHAIPAHLGRLLAYALRDDQANDQQLSLINVALAYRSLPASYRGSAPTITGLNGRWAVPGTTYGQSIISLAKRMQG